MNKLKLFLFTILCFTSVTVLSQTENSLRFDNIDDQVTVPNASSLIANSTAISLSFWVYPENTTANSSDYDGFAGIRNNNDGDFYILQLSPTDIEVRFRNSSAIPYDIVYSGLILNAWQHFVVTYEGTTLSVYQNATLVGSVPASGIISNPSIALNIGNLDYFGTSFLTNGKIDEVSLWSIELTQQQINCIYSGAINPTEPGLQLYYRFNQGTAGGTNTAVNSLLDATGHINGTLSGFALAGATSNWVAGIPAANSSPITDLLCPGTTYTFGSQTITTPGTYYEAFPTTSGCDSIVQLILTSPTINVFVGQVGPVLTSQQTGATYQWITCSNNAPVAGATNQSYTATANGQYAVIVSLGNCSDTSVCVTVTNVGINEIEGNSISVSPNPFNEQITLFNNSNLNELNISIYDALGKEVMNALLNEKSLNTINTSLLNKGTYWIVVKETNQRMMVVKK